LNGTVTASNNAAITDSGFYYQTTPGVTTSGTKLSAGGTAQSPFSVSATGLNPNQTYYYRAYAQNFVGTTLDSSGDTTFTTLPNTPTAPSVGGATPSSLNVAIGAGDGNTTLTTYAIFEATQGKFVQSADGSLNTSADFETAATWDIITVTGLAHGHYYNFKVEAQNSAGFDTVFGPGTTAGTVTVPFTPGNLAVERLGDGTQTLTTSGNTIFLDEFTTNGTAVQSIQIPSSGPFAVIEDGTTSVGGGMTRSSDGQLLCFPGYNTTQPYVSSITSASSVSVPRAVGTVNASGIFQLAVTTTTHYSGQVIRGASTDGSGNFWTSGSASSGVGGGICYLGTNNSAVTLTDGTFRWAFLFGTNLWFDVQNSSGSGGYNLGVYEFVGAPTNSGATPNIVFTNLASPSISP
jgi:hypothetical protein